MRKLTLPALTLAALAAATLPVDAQSFLSIPLTSSHGEHPGPGSAVEALRSRLTSMVALPEFGRIAYRPPLKGNEGPIVILAHGVYAGASHLAFRELLPRLDEAGARVYIFDLPGSGESDKPKRTYDIESLDRFLEAFLERALDEQAGAPVTLVAESVTTAAALRVSATRPDLVDYLVLLSPTGINTLADSPSELQSSLFSRLWNNEQTGLAYYRSLFSDESLRFFLQRAYFNDDLVDAIRIKEARLARSNSDQRWLTFSFVGGKIYRTFAEASKDVIVTTLAIFGEGAEAISSDAQDLENPAAFRSIRPDFSYLVLPQAGLSVHRERPHDVARAILSLASPKRRTAIAPTTQLD